MRKGRSSRRSRVSRPLIGSKPPSASDLSAEVSSVGGPRVVVGVSPSEPPASSEMPASIETKSQSQSPSVDVGSVAKSILETPLPVSEERAIEAAAKDKDEDKKEEGTTKLFASTLAFGSPKEPPTSITDKINDAKIQDDKTAVFASKFDTTLVDDQKKNEKAAKDEKSDDKSDDKTKMFASTLVLGSTTKKEEASEPNTKRSFASTLAFGSLDASKADVKPAAEPIPAKLDKTEKMSVSSTSDAKKNADGKKQKNKDKNAKKGSSSSSASGTSTSTSTPSTDPDEISVPPIGDVVSEKFFSEGDLSRHVAAEQHVHVEDALTVQDKAKRKLDPVVVQRRARFVRYVKFAVAGAAVVCLAAVARETFFSSVREALPATATKAAEPAAAPIAADPAAAAAASATAPVGTTTADPVASADPAAPTTPDPAASAAASAAPAATADAPKEEEVAGDPKEEKAKCKSLLEHRKIAEAIEAGEKSVALDPTDGEAWLLLGASYQEKGNNVSARKAYASCVKEATTGPKYECAKMLR